jgi:hypothetical protein
VKDLLVNHNLDDLHLLTAIATHVHIQQARDAKQIVTDAEEDQLDPNPT